VSGIYAYVADGGSGLQVISITNPASPVIVGTADTPGGAQGVVVSGTYAYVADYGSGLQVIDIANPANPVVVGTRTRRAMPTASPCRESTPTSQMGIRSPGD